MLMFEYLKNGKNHMVSKGRKGRGPVSPAAVK